MNIKRRALSCASVNTMTLSDWNRNPNIASGVAVLGVPQGLLPLTPGSAAERVLCLSVCPLVQPPPGSEGGPTPGLACRRAPAYLRDQLCRGSEVINNVVDLTLGGR